MTAFSDTSKGMEVALKDRLDSSFGRTETSILISSKKILRGSVAAAQWLTGGTGNLLRG